MAVTGNISHNSTTEVSGNFVVSLNLTATSNTSANVSNYAITSTQANTLNDANTFATSWTPSWVNTSNNLTTYSNTISLSIPTANVGNYYFFSQYRDETGNTSPLYYVRRTLDNINPTVTINSISYRFNQATSDFRLSCNFTALDSIGITEYAIVLNNSSSAPLTSNPLSYSYNNIASSGQSVTINHTDTTTTPGTYYYHVVVKDQNGNLSTPVTSSAFTIETTVPTLTNFSMNTASILANNDYQVFLDIGGTDASNIEAYSISRDSANTNWTSITPVSPYSDTVSIIIPGSEPEGVKPLYLRLRDGLGNISAVSPAVNYTLDKTAPVGTITRNSITQDATNYYITSDLTADDSNGVTHYAYAYDNFAPSNWVSVGTPSTTWSGSATLTIPKTETGSKIISVRYRDSSGNISVLYSYALTLDNVSPTLTFGFDRIEKRATSYDIFYDVTSTDASGIKWYALDSNSVNTFVPNNWVEIPNETTHFDRNLVVNIPDSEAEGTKNIAILTRDRFQNVSPIRRDVINFDKSPPTGTFDYSFVSSGDTYWDLFSKVNYTDNYGITSYLFQVDEANIAPTADWTEISATTNLNANVPLKLLKSRGDANTMNVYFWTKDLFGNISNVNNYTLTTSTQRPNGSFSYLTGTKDVNNYTLTFSCEGQHPNNSKIRWVSIVHADENIEDWQEVSNNNVHATFNHTINVPSTEAGTLNFYYKVQDEWRNSSPIYRTDLYLDDVRPTGAIKINRVEKIGSNFVIHVNILGTDEKGLKEYAFSVDDPSPNTFVSITPTSNANVAVSNTNAVLYGGTRTFYAKWKDNFNNISDVFSTSLQMDSVPPTLSLQYLGTSNPSNTANIIFNYSGTITDSGSLGLQDYKLSMNANSSWITIPGNLDTYQANVSFEVPLVNGASYTTHLQARDQFQNFANTSDTKTIDTSAPTINRNNWGDTSLNSPLNTWLENGARVNYSIQATAPTGASLVELQQRFYYVSGGSKFLLDSNTMPLGLVSTYPPGFNFFNYDFIGNYGTFRIEFRYLTDFGGDTGWNTLTPNADRSFDVTAPVLSVEHLQSRVVGTNFVVLARIQATDSGSGVKFYSLTNGLASWQSISRTSSLDIQATFSYPSGTSSPSNLVARAMDVAGNDITNTISIPVDWNGPTSMSISMDSGNGYTNNNSVSITAAASDGAGVQRYALTRASTKGMADSGWVSANSVTNFTTTENYNIPGNGHTEGIITVYFHAHDIYRNASVASDQICYDITKPTITGSLRPTIGRTTISGSDYFEIFYNLRIEDTNSKIKRFIVRNESTYLPGQYTTFADASMPSLIDRTGFTNSIAVLTGNYGDTTIKMDAFDRAGNKSTTLSFPIHLENIPPVINENIINGGDTYTRTKDCYVRIDGSDAQGITHFLASNVSSETWNSSGWIGVAGAPATTINNTYGIDLEALGFTEGECNVHFYLKDWCQNVVSNNDIIIYDKTAPANVSITRTNIVFTSTSIDIDLTISADDNNSQLDAYALANYSNPTNWANTSLPATTHSLTQTFSIPSNDYGWKTYYVRYRDRAGNISLQNSYSFFVDTVNPTITLFELNGGDNIIGNNATWTLNAYDNRIISAYDVNLSSSLVVSQVNNTINAISMSNTGTINLSSVPDGPARVYGYVKDGFDNMVMNDYTFTKDGTPPANTTAVIDRVVRNGSNYHLYFDLSADDMTGITRYRYRGNSSTVDISRNITSATVLNLQDEEFVVASSALDYNDHIISFYDFPGNEANVSITWGLTTTPPTVDFKINGSATPSISISDATGTWTSSTTTGIAGVNIIKYAITTSSSLDIYSPFWKNVGTPGTNYNISSDLANFNISLYNLNRTGTETIYMHVLDSSGNMGSDSVAITWSGTTLQPNISAINVDSIERIGNKFRFQIDVTGGDSNNLADYSIKTGNTYPPSGLTWDDWKTTPESSSDAITNINGMFELPNNVDSYFIYIRFRDVDGNMSNIFSIPIGRIYNEKPQINDLILDDYYSNDTNIRIRIKGKSKNLLTNYSIMLNTTNSPSVADWVNWTNTWQDPDGDFDTGSNLQTFSGLSLSSTTGYNYGYIYLKDAYSFIERKKFEYHFDATRPTGIISQVSLILRNGRKYLEVLATAEDTNSAISRISFTVGTTTPSWENITPTRRVNLRRTFDWVSTDTTTKVIYFNVEDVIGNTISPIPSLTVDLSTI